MPQMAPLNWFFLYMYFSSIFLMMIIMNYYMFLYMPKTILFKKTNKVIFWKW